jgi:hypothetical protein
MSALTYQLRVLSAAIIAVVVIMLVMLALHIKGSTLQTRGMRAIQERLTQNYYQNHMAALPDASDAAVSDRELELRSAALNQVPQYQILALRPLVENKREILLASHLSVEIDLQVNGRTPPDGRTKRYFVMKHSWLSGWKVDYERQPPGAKVK